MIKNLTKQEKRLLIITIFVIALAFIFNFIFIPVNNKWVKINQEISIKELVLEKYDDLSRGEQERGLNYFLDSKKYKSEVEVLNSLFGLADKMSNKSGVNLVSIRSSGNEKENDFTKFRLEIKIDGSFKNILSFIENISKTNSNFLVEELQINKSTQPNSLSARLLISKLVII